MAAFKRLPECLRYPERMEHGADEAGGEAASDVDVEPDESDAEDDV